MVETKIKEKATLEDIYGHALYLVSSKSVLDVKEAARISLEKLENPEIYREAIVFDIDRNSLLESIENYVRSTLFPNK